MRRARDPLAFLQSVAEKPWEHDFFHVLRRIECLHAEGPRIGKAVRPAQEPIRLGQDPSLEFAPAVLSGVITDADQPAKIQVRFLGLLGPNGPLPLHLTDYARGRILHGSDTTFARFSGMLSTAQTSTKPSCMAPATARSTARSLAPARR